MSDIKSIILANPGPVASTWVVINHRENDQEWDIVSVELCQDAEGLDVIGDHTMAELSRDIQEQIYTALAVYTEKNRRERGMRRLWNDIRADQAAARVLEGART